MRHPIRTLVGLGALAIAFCTEGTGSPNDEGKTTVSAVPGNCAVPLAMAAKAAVAFGRTVAGLGEYDELATDARYGSSVARAPYLHACPISQGPPYGAPERNKQPAI